MDQSQPRPLRPSEDVLARRVGDETVLVDLATNRIFSLNSTGARLWELLTEGIQPDAARTTLLAEFDVAEEALAAEIASFCDLLERERLVSRAVE